MNKLNEKKPNLKIKMQEGMPMVNTHAAGIDIGDTEHYVAIRDNQGFPEIRSFGAFTEDLHSIVSWLKAEGITTVAIESTGVYWLALYLFLEESGIEPYLVNAKHVKNVTGRKKDDSDALWIQKLHSCGLLQKSFQPDEEYRILRTYVRQRKNLITICSDSVRRMQKSLELMNIKIHTVISDLLGKTGLEMIRAILDGERNPSELAKLKDPRIKASEHDIIRSLEGIWKDEYLFLLKQAYDEYQFYQIQISVCEDKIIEQLLKQSAIIKQGDISGLIPEKDVKKKCRRKNQFKIPIAPILNILTGIDLTKIPSISEVTALEFISETGTDMTKWASSKHFSAWLNVSPNTKITGGKIISSKIMKKKNIAGQSLRMAASSLYNNKTPLGDFYKRMKSKHGGKGAVLDTAHKLARTIYVLLMEQKEYDPILVDENHEKVRNQKIKYYEKQLAKLKMVA